MPAMSFQRLKHLQPDETLQFRPVSHRMAFDPQAEAEAYIGTRDKANTDLVTRVSVKLADSFDPTHFLAAVASPDVPTSFWSEEEKQLASEDIPEAADFRKRSEPFPKLTAFIQKVQTGRVVPPRRLRRKVKTLWGRSFG